MAKQSDPSLHGSQVGAGSPQSPAGPEHSEGAGEELRGAEAVSAPAAASATSSAIVEPGTEAPAAAAVVAIADTGKPKVESPIDWVTIKLSMQGFRGHH